MATTQDLKDREKAAAESIWPARIARFTRWVADAPHSRRKLTQTGRLTIADARTLVEQLGTGDVIDPVIGNQTFRTQSSEELTGLFLTLEWARAAGLVRRQGNYLVTVKKRGALVDRPLELMGRMVEVLGELGPAVCPSGWGQSILHDDFAIGAEALLVAMDAAPDGVDVQAVSDHVWARLSPLYRTRDLTDDQLDRWRRTLTRDIWRAVELLAETGLVALDLTIDHEERRVGPVPVTALGRWAVRHARGGPAEGEPVLQLRIELVDSADPVVWRQVLVPASSTLGDLHAVIQAAMGWQNSHLHQFSVGDTRYGPGGTGLDTIPEDSARLGEVAGTGTVVEYLYDFGDSWEHLVTVEAATVALATSSYPRCVGGEGACPPEDCGGIPGYEELRLTLADPCAPDHDEMISWLGLPSPAAFDPARFAVREANLRLATRARAGRPS